MTPDKNIIITYLIILAGGTITGFLPGRKYQIKEKRTYANILFGMGVISLVLLIIVLWQNYTVFTK